MTGVDSRRNGRIWRSDGPSARAPGPQRLAASGRAASASVLTLPSVVCVDGQRRGQLLQRGAQVASWLRERAEDRVGVLDEVRELRVALAQRVGQQREVVHHARDVRAPRRQRLVDLARVLRASARGGGSSAPSCGPCSAAEALRAVVEQQQQVVARVGVQRRRGSRRG